MRATPCILLLSLAAACGGDDAESPTDSGTTVVDGGHLDGGHADASVPTDAASSPGTDAGACTTTVSLQDYKLVPAAVTVPSGASVICAVNDGKTPHDFVVRDSAKNNLGRTVVLGPGETGKLSITLTAGSYGTYCSVAGHESLGMVGTLTVQ